MKKLSGVLLSGICAMGLLLVPSVSHAVDGKVGLTMMGAWWKPAFIDFENESAAKLFGVNFDTNYSGAFMMGPTFSIAMTRSWSFGTTLLIGVSRNQFEYSSFAIDVKLFSLPLSDYIDIGQSKVRRYDWDVNFNWNFHKFFDLLLGVRFNYGGGEGDSFRMPLDVKTEEYSAWYLGPMAGIVFHIEPVRNFTISATAALLFQFGQYNNEKKILLDGDPFLIYYFLPLKYEVGYVCIGLNNDVRFSYLIAPIHLEVFVGGRYVLLPHISAGDDGSVLDISYKDGWIGGKVDHWGGIYFGAAYKF